MVDASRKGDLTLTSIEQRDVVVVLKEPRHDMGANKTCTANDQNSHLPPALLRTRDNPIAELSGLIVHDHNHGATVNQTQTAFRNHAILNVPVDRSVSF
jgi:hypothetical protein